MVFSAQPGLEVPCRFGMCLKGDMCPHVVQVALTTNHAGVLGKSEGTVVLKDVITTPNTAIARSEGGLFNTTIYFISIKPLVAPPPTLIPPIFLVPQKHRRLPMRVLVP